MDDETRRRLLEERRADGTADPPPPGNPAPYYGRKEPQGLLERWKEKGGILGALASILLVLAKIGAPVLVLLAKVKTLLIAFKLFWIVKVFITFGSMVISMWAWASRWGWPMGIGFVLLIFVHECGHALAGRMRGIPMSGMVFIPFMGAAVALKRGGKDLAEDAFIGIMGPVFGTIGGVFCVLAFLATRSPFWLVLAEINFFMNLFNLAPMAPLDGGWIVPVFSPKLLAVGVVLLVIMMPHNPLLWVLAVLSLPRIVGGWRTNPDMELIRSSAFEVSDFRDPAAFATLLDKSGDPVSMYLESRFSYSVPGLLEQVASTPQPSEEMLLALANAFNLALQDISLSVNNRFAGVTLRPETQQLFAEHSGQAASIRLNRLLLEDAYPNHIARSHVYYQATTADRWKFGLAYLGLAAFLALCTYELQQYLAALHTYVA